MANARALDKRRKSIRNIRKITRTMELIATARFKKAMDRAVGSYERIRTAFPAVVADLAKADLQVILIRCWKHTIRHRKRSPYLVLSANRGLCGRLQR